MVVPPSGGGGPAAGHTSTFRVSPANGSASTHHPRGRMGGAAAPSQGPASAGGGSAGGAGGERQANGSIVPLSARRAPALDLRTVERRGQANAAREIQKSTRMFGLQEAPTFRPTDEEFRDPMEYMRKIAPEGRKYGIIKIVPPDGWNPDFAVDTERFHFRTRRQELNSVEGGTRANLNYLDQLSKFHRQHGTNLNRFPSVDKRPLDLYKLKKAVECRGGFDKVCKQKKWAEIGRDLGYSGKIMSSLSTSLKNSYQKWLYPYEEYLKLAKPGVHQMLEYENGGPFTPSPAPSPLKKTQQTPSSVGASDSPAVRASGALNSTLQDGPPPSDTNRPAAGASSGGFTAVNSGGFTAVNTQPASAGSSFSAINSANGMPQRDKKETAESTPKRAGESPATTAKNTPDLRPSVLEAGPLSNGTGNPMKRQLSQGEDGAANGESENSGRRSKRLKKEAAPTVAGSHMMQPRISQNPRIMPHKDPGDSKGDACESCGRGDDPTAMLLCDSCDAGYHRHCLEPPLKTVPDYDWHCPKCLVGTGEFGFEDGGIYSLKQFQEKANNFKENHFAGKMPFDPIKNTKRAVTEDVVEREFWRLVESLTETVEVEYGADVHSTTHGSGFPTIEKKPRDPYSSDPWNLNILPLHNESLFRNIKSNISGMTVPWLYVGMCFSTFCWHAEDHYAYSANYQHFGSTKTWYGIPAEDADKFEEAMREAVPELFETQPDLLFQLVTLLTPEQLKKAGVRVYALDQRAGQFVVTFPQAYHAGFNHGFNFNEAVNFAPADWEPFGEAGVLRLADFRRQPCFSHDELLLTASAQKDLTIKTAKWLAPAMQRMMERELRARENYLRKHKAILGEGKHPWCVVEGSKEDGGDEGEEEEDSFGCNSVVDSSDVPEDEQVCVFCKAYAYLSRFECKRSRKTVCLIHAGTHDCCEVATEEARADRLSGRSDEHRLVVRITSERLRGMVQRVVERSEVPEAWAQKLDGLLELDPKPPLKSLRSLLSEGEKIAWDLPALPELRRYVERCNEWVEEAIGYITRRQQSRRKNERSWRKSAVGSKTAEADEREREYRKVENINRLLTTADELSFDCPEIQTLRERSEAIAEFRRDALAALSSHGLRTTQELDDLVEVGKSFNVDIPEVEKLDKVVQQLKWVDQAHEKRPGVVVPTLPEVVDFIKQGRDLGIADHDSIMVQYLEMRQNGELWEAKANELMAVENVHYQQLDALCRQAATIPVTPATLAKVDGILKKQRDAQEQILSLYERSKNADFRQRPKYKDVREAMSELEELNSKPNGTIDLEKEQKRHEDWMRRGKKLFGKANAPLHILHAHMRAVDEKNRACFDTQDQPRMPVEPASRANTPDEGQDMDGSMSMRDVFCICRKPEAGMMIECELCHEWYHGKCLKIARGKVKEDDKYTCPICDHRVAIPRDAARPKLEDLANWQVEIPTLPFQPEEEETLDSIVGTGQNFRNWVSQYINPLMSNPDELVTQRFYLRKLEGADILLADEINFFRQELHKWAPVAPTPPPILEVSLSTRKPRPTKQQKLMAQFGVTDPDDLPAHVKPKHQHYKSRNKQGGDGAGGSGGGGASASPARRGSIVSGGGAGASNNPKAHLSGHSPSSGTTGGGEVRSHTPPYQPGLVGRNYSVDSAHYARGQPPSPIFGNSNAAAHSPPPLHHHHRAHSSAHGGRAGPPALNTGVPTAGATLHRPSTPPSALMSPTNPGTHDPNNPPLDPAMFASPLPRFDPTGPLSAGPPSSAGGASASGLGLDTIFRSSGGSSSGGAGKGASGGAGAERGIAGEGDDAATRRAGLDSMFRLGGDVDDDGVDAAGGAGAVDEAFLAADELAYDGYSEFGEEE